MIRLDTTSRSLQLDTTVAVGVDAPTVTVSYSDKTTTSYNGASQLSLVSSTASRNICDAPSAGSIRDIDLIDIKNNDGVSHQFTVSVKDGSLLYPLARMTLATGEMTVYTHASGWSVYDSAGALKSATTTPTSSTFDFIQFNTAAGAPAYAEGKVFYDLGEHTLAYYNDSTGVTVNVGQELLVRVRNTTGSTLTDGQVVYVNGATGNRPTVALAIATSDATSEGTIGVVTDAITNNSDGYVTVSGVVRGLNTSAYAEGTLLYLSDSVAGGWTDVVPVTPNHTVRVAYVTYQHGVNGTVYVKVEDGYELDELHDVKITGIADNNLLQWNSATPAWENVAGPAGAIVGTTDTQTLTGKTFNLTSNTLSGTKAQFDTACSDGNFAYIGQANTFTANQVVSVTDATNAALRVTQLGAGDTLVVEDSAVRLRVTSAGVIQDGNGLELGWKTIPQNSQSTAYTCVLADAGKHLLHPSADTTARTFTIPANASVAYPVGAAITFVNQDSAGVVTIAITSDTMRLAGAGTAGSRTLAANGIATAMKITSTEWIISGVGLT